MGKKPTEREMQIIQVLWKEAPCTVREVLNKMNESREEPLAYTTVLRFLQIMTGKGLVTREIKDRTHFYSASGSASQTKKMLARDLLDRVFSGSPRDLVLHLLGDESTNAEELAEIQKALRELEEENDAG